jgi:arylformamidase
MRRRYFIAGASALGFCVGPSAFGQSRKVFLDYTQEELDQAYDQAFWTPQLNELQADDARASAEARNRLPPKTMAYGKADIEVVDIFTPTNANRVPILVYIHGGAWLFNRRTDASFPAPGLVARNAALLVPDFNNVKEARLPAIVEQCRSAVEWAVRNAASFGGDPDRVYVAGHSSGAHLASCVLITDWTKRGLPADTVKGGFLMSGMYDLYPAMLSSRGKYVQITEAEQAEASAMRHLHRIACPVALCWAQVDSPEFRRQSMVFADSLEGLGKLASRTIAVANHFTEIKQLTKPDSPVSRALYALMKI